MAKIKQRPKATQQARKQPDDFKSVARRLECDEDLAAFDAKLKKIATAKPKPARGK